MENQAAKAKIKILKAGNWNEVFAGVLLIFYGISRIPVIIFGNQTREPSRGFTLIELIVVITLISVMMFFAIPRLNTSLLESDSRKVSKWMLLTVKALKNKAVRQQIPLLLQVDLDNHKLWTAVDFQTTDQPADPLSGPVFGPMSGKMKALEGNDSRETGSEAGGKLKLLEAAKGEEFKLPDGFRLLDVLFPGKVPISTGIATIRFYPKGYSDQVMIHLADDHADRITYEIKPFLPLLHIHDGYIEF